MQKKKSVFKIAYLIYLGVLVVLVVFATFYVSRLLQKYEDTRPESYVENAIEDLKELAVEGTLWNSYFLPEFETGKYEAGLDVEKEYENRLVNGNVEYYQKSGDYPEDEMYYLVLCDGAALAEVKLKAKGPAVTKLVILNYREWNVEYIKPIVEKSDFTVQVPDSFTVKANGILLTADEGEKGMQGDVKYTIEDVYFAPKMDITDAQGQVVSYEYNEKQIIAEYYYYTLVLPDTLTVKVNGQTLNGTEQGNHSLCYEIKELTKPEVLISDYYGNEFVYEGGRKIPLTHKLISTENGYEVQVMDEDVPDEAIYTSANPAYETLAAYVEDLPQMTLYNVAVLKEDAKVCVIDNTGKENVLDDSAIEYSFTAQDKYLDSVPEEIGEEVDVLALAQKWSLFMSADLNFQEMSKYLIKDSYQYEVAKKYATGVDIKFISEHTLGNPPFTEESVTNFVWITKDCFSVDISFVKNMILTSGARRKDPMNDRFYFAKYDDTEDGVDNPTWKIVSMKEIVNDAE